MELNTVLPLVFSCIIFHLGLCSGARIYWQSVITVHVELILFFKSSTFTLSYIFGVRVTCLTKGI